MNGIDSKTSSIRRRKVKPTFTNNFMSCASLTGEGLWRNVREAKKTLRGESLSGALMWRAFFTQGLS